MFIDPNSVDFVIYHARCSDGFGAAWSAWKLLGDNATYYAAEHGDDPPDVSGKNVAILDFCYSNSVIKKMIASAKSLIIIDHHKSRVAEMEDIECKIFDMNRSGAMMAWNFFHPNVSPPLLIKYIEDRDLWRWKLPLSKEFSAVFDLVDFKFEDFEKYNNEEEIAKAQVLGGQILQYTKLALVKIERRAVIKTMFGKKVAVINANYWIDEIGDDLAKTCDCDFAMMWSYDHRKKAISVSLRSFKEDVDVSKIATRFPGGGGHKKSSGFTIPGSDIESIFDK